MFKNLSPSALGISGHESEIIELALTYGFRGVDLDIADLEAAVQRVVSLGGTKLDRFSEYGITWAVMADPEVALEVHAREELGVNPEETGNPVAAALPLLGALAGDEAAHVVLPHVNGLQLAFDVGTG